MNASTQQGAAVLVVGEALVDIVRSADGGREFPGGSPLNVAYGLARLGVPTMLQTRFARDERGALVRSHLRGAGVELWPGSDDARRTSTAIAHLGPDGAATYEFDIDWDVTAVDVPERFRAVHAGSIAAFLEPGASAVRRTLASVGSSTLVTFDPNFRPALVGPREAALAAFERTVRLAHVVKLSDEDAAWLFPGWGVDDALARVLELGADLAVCTLGAAGARLRTRDRTVTVPAVMVSVADTIGAGDSFMSSLIAEVLKRPVPPARLDDEALAAVGGAAVRAAGITVSRPGAQPPTAEELAAFSPPSTGGQRAPDQDTASRTGGSQPAGTGGQ